MAFFSSRKNSVLDLTERYKRQQEKLAELKAEREEAIAMQNSADSQNSSSGGFFGFLDLASANQNSQLKNSSEQANENVDSESTEERRRKLGKRLLDITNKLEDLSNQIYHLTQRLEVVEKKMNINNFE